MKHKITTITVSYNAHKTIERTIKSVIAQNCKDIEYIVIDGGSTDGTVDIIKKYCDYITYWVSEPDKGIYDAMNKALRKATGEYVNFLNAGDWYLRDTMANVFYYLDHSDAHVLYGDVMCVGESGKRTACVPFPLEDINWNMPMCHQAVFMRNFKGNFFDMNYSIAADYKMMLKMYLEGRKFQHIPCVVANYALGGISSNRYATNMEFIDIASSMLLEYNNDVEMNRAQIRKNFIINESYHLFQLGENHESIKQYVRTNIKNKENVIIFGVGEIAAKFIGILSDAGCKPRFFVDNSKNKWGTQFNGFPILTPDALYDEKNASLLVMSEKYGYEILEQLESMSLDPSIEVYDYIGMKGKYLQDTEMSLIEIGKEKLESFRKLMEL